jgi:DNA (cytosine-5)-methyltransferase 1
MKKTVLDIFCGTGGFSEGFRQKGFEVIRGLDSWAPAIRTFNHNFGLSCQTENILDYETSIENIEALPNTAVILGGPPCVSFSSSNQSGKANKSPGIKLTEVFFRIVAVKMWRKGSNLEAWFMENVPRAKKYLKDEYTFQDLKLGEWADENGISRLQPAIRIKNNCQVINCAYYGVPQNRRRLITGEVVQKKGLTIPPISHKHPKEKTSHPDHIPLRTVKNSLPKPCETYDARMVNDPNYPEVKIKRYHLSDQFYDTGLYKCEWEQSRYFKINHPYMGRMSFPEDENKPSRTITATTIGTSREAIIYKSEYSRIGDGQFRIPTIREFACLMGFPITFQFAGSEGTKARLVGNAVCPPIARALAEQVLMTLGIQNSEERTVLKEPDLSLGDNLNSCKTRVFDNPPKRKQGARFRRHPIKGGNITVTLSNYDILTKEKNKGKWITSVQVGKGEGFISRNYPDGFNQQLEELLREFNEGNNFLKELEMIKKRVPDGLTLQKMYEQRSSNGLYYEPTGLVKEIGDIIQMNDPHNRLFTQNSWKIFPKKLIVPLKQVFALHAINSITTIANNKQLKDKTLCSSEKKQLLRD